MTSDRTSEHDLDHVLEAWLRPGPSDLPSDRFAAIVRDVAHTRQRRRLRFDVRGLIAEPLNWAMAAAVVLLVVTSGTWLLGAWARPGTDGPAGGHGWPAPASAQPPAAQVVPVVLTASNFAFDPAAMSVPSGARIRVTLVNKEGQQVPHGLEIVDDGGRVLFTGPIVEGTASGASMTFDIPPLADGRYVFDDPIHPNMTGALYVGEPVPSSAATPSPDAVVPADVAVATQGGKLVPSAVSFEAGRRFSLEFRNNDEGVEHRIVIEGPDGAAVFQAGPVTGPGTIRYPIDALPAGIYTLFDPASRDMVATLTIGGTSGTDGSSTSPTPQVTPAPLATDAPAGGAVIGLAAQGLSFDHTDLYAPADTPFTVRVDNLDHGIPHGFDVLSEAGRLLVSGEIVNGPGVISVAVPALPAGRYTFMDPVHGPTMAGILHVGETAPSDAPPPTQQPAP